MVLSLEHDIKDTKSHQNLLSAQTVIVAHAVLKKCLLLFPSTAKSYMLNMYSTKSDANFSFAKKQLSLEPPNEFS
jgi:hypothetical protein